MRLLLSFIALSLCFACDKQHNEQVTHSQDYNSFLNTSNNQSYTEAVTEMNFWNNRLDADSTGVGELGPLANAYATIFTTTGDAQNLYAAERLYKKAIAISANNKDGYVRGLARNYISQHRFKEAKTILEESYAGISNKRATEMILFDVYMELGEYAKADTLLGRIKNTGDYNYLIRLAKWSDYKGDLEAAIKYLEKAKTIAEQRGGDGLRIWTYTNLADFYGHAGNIKDAYIHYLKTLQLQPDNSYAKKGITWILYASEGNTKEANRILDSVMVQHKIPDYYLLKAEMAEYEGNTSEATMFTNKFVSAAEAGNYGGMYNAFLIEIFAETNPEKAVQLAEIEIGNRATPETYDLLAYAQLKAGRKDAALETIEAFVIGKTFEPMAQYHAALIYKANGMDEKVQPLKEELLEASFELGPVLTKSIEDL
ncbi:tetratricopeptide repeat protein [Ulvibacter sp. MAR_2010_11]|uniref:tetratricopeptide repeat protein n=1 Tax=Ulvibacter sp. MAR_2010_11 TaxID=1250229 RepID=UPI000C2C4F29|nr:hypothetical protein [Ulvibacter sp. MAR_2010_11]PKA83870.1 tetratricopeptide repeat protein [Ulvibacter sp. MAR_2010_11]